MEKVRIGFIGVGGMAEYHMKTLQQIDDAVITAVCDMNADRAREIAETFGAKPYGTLEEMLDAGVIDALYICTPPFAREGIEEAAAARGIHLLSEKPTGLQMEEVRRKEQIIRESGIIHSSGYCLRYLDTVQKAKQYLADKQVDMVLAYRIGGMPEVGWWRLMNLSGGQLVEQSTHQVDLIRYLAGEFDYVQANYEQRHIHRNYPEATVYDVGIVSFGLRSGALGTISNTVLSRKIGRGDVEFFGHDFYVSISGMTVRIVDDTQDVTLTSEMDFYLEQNRAFVAAVKTGRQELVLGDYSEAAATLEVTLAANDSAVAKQTIKITST
ncbi:gfo/Idh/MocA family oxidoreductase [Paenibacillus sp. LMG 31458]|uniref:Gfo/Idh/MocA family oxidoreductase n=1 Tax=Paenibacillus phytorum TaxID=2654977 RepID=A0ABX1Y2R5_9BACL|nr:Gfo/Idh/MocA family oxidoreductase [Paenibacillus phytorum]NOU75108.1 gfo/Idh/MocA family oxidoreductase [Paenibacillus phytorum]